MHTIVTVGVVVLFSQAVVAQRDYLEYWGGDSSPVPKNDWTYLVFLGLGIGLWSIGRQLESHHVERPSWTVLAWVLVLVIAWVWANT